jgi:hypothetical protein
MKPITIFTTLALTLPCAADMGPIPIKETAIREPVQNAIILFDQAKKRETIVLQTKLVSSRNAKGLFFMPLPSKPKVSTAKPDIFTRVVGFAKAEGVKFKLVDIWGTTLGGGSGGGAKTKGITVEFTETLAEHDVTVIRVESWDHLRQWLVQFMADKKIPMVFDLGKIKDTVIAYAKDDVRFFLFDVVNLAKVEQSTHPLVIDFESDKLYYPLRVNALYDGPSDVQLLVFSPSRIPKGRFEHIGFLESAQIDVSPSQSRSLWPGIPQRIPGQLNMMCCYMPDPRKVYQEFHPHRTYLQNRPVLKRCALARWKRDVNLSLFWGKSQEPDYTVHPIFSMVKPDWGEDWGK